jgi:hypothetical protein
MHVDERSIWLDDTIAADDVCLASQGGDLYLAWSASTLRTETVQLARLSDQGLELLLAVDGAFRPALCASEAGPVLACCRMCADRIEPAVFLPGKDHRPLSIRTDTPARQVALAPAPGGVWLAWEQAGGTTVVGHAGRDRFRSAGTVEGTAPALVSTATGSHLAWVSGGDLRVAPLAPSGVGKPRVVARGREQDPPGAPALAADGQGGWWLAWHEPLAEGIIRWLRLCGASADASPQPPRDCREARGVDQGWEFPALLVDGDGRLWLAGRSSNGFHLQVRTAAGWSPRRDLSGPGWSNRSRSCGLAWLGDRVIFARGTPEGLRVSQLSVETAACVAEQATVPLPATHYASVRRWPGVLFGDLHQHSVCSDGTGEAERAYLRAREVYRHEIFALTDHEKLGRRCLGPVTWRYQCQLADAFYRPGEFVTLRAYEFTGARLPGPGHKCVYFDEQVPDSLPDKDVASLFAALRLHGGIAVPHHTAWTGAGLEHHDPVLQPVWEICSVHGAYEVPEERRIPPRDDVLLEGQFLRQALDAGLVFGFVGGSDAHGLRWHHGVGRQVDPLRTGLTAVFAEADRQSVLQALRARRCYATSGARILLRVSLDGAPMGSVLSHWRGELHVEVEGTAPVERLSVVQDGHEVLADSGGAALSCTVRLETRAGRSYCYVRVQQTDGEAAWSSPVWLSP